MSFTIFYKCFDIFSTLILPFFYYLVAIHPVLTYDSVTKYSFMKTQTRVASQEYRNELDESNCCQQVWILGDTVLSFYDSAWFKSAAGIDVMMTVMEGLELEWYVCSPKFIVNLYCKL